MLKYSLVLMSLFLIYGCGGGSGDKKTETNTSIETDQNTTVQLPPQEEKVHTNKVQLGPVTGATVQIFTLDEVHNLYTTTTNDIGKYTININEFNTTLNSLSDYPEYVLITASGGLDIDPEDDGNISNSEPIAVNGTVKGIFKTSILLSEQDLSINLLSTAVSHILEDKESIDDELIAYTAQQLNAEDINGDGKVDNHDIITYAMDSDDGELEDTLRNNGFLDAIHDGDSSALQGITDEFKEQYNLMFIKYSINNGVANLEIENSKDGSRIMYIINAKKNDIFNNIYSSAISLNKNDYVVYKECKNDICSVVQIASFDGDKVHQYFLRISNFGIYSDMEYMNNLREAINNDSIALKEAKENIVTLSTEIESLDTNITNLQSQVDEINSSLELGL